MSGRGGDRLVAFDLGGVLVRICKDWHEGCAVAGVAPRGIPQPQDPARLRELVSVHQRGSMDHADFCSAVSTCLGSALSAEQVAAVHDAWILGEYPGVTELLRELGRHGHRTACLSNTNAPHWRTLERMPFFAALGHTHASHLMGLGKPDPAIFRAFEIAVGASGDRIAYFDDLGENCRAAESAGWLVRQIDPTRDTVPQIRQALQSWGLLA